MAIHRPSGTFDRNYGEDMAIVRTPFQWFLLMGFLTLLLTMPLWTSSSILYLANLIGISLIAVQGLNILTGYCGQLNLG